MLMHCGIAAWALPGDERRVTTAFVVATVAGNVDLVVHLACDGAGRCWFRLREVAARDVCAIAGSGHTESLGRSGCAQWVPAMRGMGSPEVNRSDGSASPVRQALNALM